MRNMWFVVLVTVFLSISSGCATITGTVAGAPAGMIDAPAETYRANRKAFDKLPILHSLNVVVMGPVGILTGPVLGFGKGVSLDVQWMIGQQDYGKVFGSYDAQSIWRPYTVKWGIEE